VANAGTLKHEDLVRQLVAQKRWQMAVNLHEIAFFDTNCCSWSSIWAVMYEMNVDLFSRASQLGTAASATSIFAKTANVSPTSKTVANDISINDRQVCTG